MICSYWFAQIMWLVKTISFFVVRNGAKHFYYLYFFRRAGGSIQHPCRAHVFFNYISLILTDQLVPDRHGKNISFYFEGIYVSIMKCCSRMTPWCRNTATFAGIVCAKNQTFRNVQITPASTPNMFWRQHGAKSIIIKFALHSRKTTNRFSFDLQIAAIHILN